MLNETKEKVFYGFNYDKMFKAIFVGEDKKKTDLLCELLGECLETKVDRIIKFIPVELNARRKKERYKRVDLLLEAGKRKINLELNSTYSEADKIRNMNYYFSFCSQHTIAGEKYDIESEFIHISLNYNVKKDTPLIKCYTIYDKSHNEELDSRFKYYEINVEKFAKFWYDNDIESVMKAPILTMIGIKDEEELEKYSKKMNNAIIKESVDNLKRLNSDVAFVYGLTPEEDELLVRNTRDEFVRREAMAEGLAEGEAKGKAEGLAEGQAKGKAEGKTEIATNLLKKDYSIEEIVEITGLTKEEIEKLRSL